MSRPLLVSALVAIAFVPTPGASASCAGPSLEVATSDQRPALRVGAAVIVEGRAFVDGCDDGGGSSAGCSPDEEPEDTEVPMKDVTLSIRQDGRTHDLATADAGDGSANDLGHVHWEIVIPSTLHQGKAYLLAGRERLPVTLTR